MQILVIDDEQPTLKMFDLMLGALGYNVLTAESGERGLELFAEHAPSLVLTDIKMPGMDGIEVLREIKSKNIATEVIVITGHGDMDLAIKALNLDATDFINKPIRREALENAISRAQDRMKLVQENAASVSISLNEDAAIISIRGTLSSPSEASLRDAFRHSGRARNNIILDFQDNTSINGAAIAVLADCLRQARAQEQNVAVAGLSGNFTQVFEVMGISKQVAFYASIDEVVFP